MAKTDISSTVHDCIGNWSLLLAPFGLLNIAFVSFSIVLSVFLSPLNLCGQMKVKRNYKYTFTK